LSASSPSPTGYAESQEWEHLSPHGASRPKNAGHTAIYDEANQRMVVFGGCYSTTAIIDVQCFITDTHALDLTSGNENWEQLFPPGPSSRLEGGHTAVYDAGNGRMIVWEGKHATTDTYALDLTPCNERWVTPTVTGTLPRARTGHSAVYDAPNERMIVFAGYLSEYPYVLTDVWALDLHLGGERWEEILPPESHPAIRAAHTAIYDAVNERMVIFGGLDSDWRPLNDVWALDLPPGHEEWHELFPSGTSPANRAYHSAIYDAGNERMVIFGGADGDSYFDDVWALSELPTTMFRIDKMGPASVKPGATFAYTLTYENAGTVTATLFISDTLPPEVSYVGSTPTGTWVSATNVVSWTISQAPGTSGTIVLTVTSPLTPCTRLTNTVEMVTDPPGVLVDDVWTTRVVPHRVYLPLIAKRSEPFISVVAW
jgi:uncharacterized repeat protein (TIGR01451 family)